MGWLKSLLLLFYNNTNYVISIGFNIPMILETIRYIMILYVLFQLYIIIEVIGMEQQLQILYSQGYTTNLLMKFYISNTSFPLN